MVEMAMTTISYLSVKYPVRISVFKLIDFRLLPANFCPISESVPFLVREYIFTDNHIQGMTLSRWWRNIQREEVERGDGFSWVVYSFHSLYNSKL